jgi:hypothetical protein
VLNKRRERVTLKVTISVFQAQLSCHPESAFSTSRLLSDTTKG